MIHPEHWGHLRSRYEKAGPRKMLAMDGGGIRGILSLGILDRIEGIVGSPLCEYFDYIAGTSTGAIIAAGLARGMTVAELRRFYDECGTEMFQSTRFLDRLNSLYRDGPLQKKFREVFGAATDLRPEHLKTLLLVVTRNVTTDSPWPISSNPDAVYNDPSRSDCNLDIPLWQLVRASTAAPIYFPPEVIKVGNEERVFVDGGMTPYNCPAFLLYRMATDPAYRLNWDRGERKLLLVSVGAGTMDSPGATAEDPQHNMLTTGLGVPGALMHGAQVDQDVSCRTVGRCSYGAEIDREVLDLIPRKGPDAGGYKDRVAREQIPISQDLGRAFLYARYNVDMSEKGLDKLGFGHVDASKVQKMDGADPENIKNLFDIGAKAGEQVSREHFGSFV